MRSGNVAVPSGELAVGSGPVGAALAGEIDAVGIVIPAHDEAELLPASLAALDVAMHHLPPHVRRLAVVVLDACSDASPRIAASWCDGAPEWTVVTISARNVGQARAAGMQHLLHAFAGIGLSRVWLATTDADSTVRPSWLTEQLRLAASGADSVAGTIELDDWREYPSGFGDQFRQFYAEQGSPDDHGHVHGANLGVRADAYLAVGGFRPLATGEDLALWRALRTASRPQISSRHIPVTTSARRATRVPAGLGGFLSILARP
ncbi:MAG TPA: glycosyltransferase [Kofleriaceae bacterium]